jgi:hypothetical protein
MVLRTKNKELSGQNQNNVSVWKDISTHRLLLQWTSTLKIQLRLLVFSFFVSKCVSRCSYLNSLHITCYSLCFLLNENYIAFNIKKLILGDTIQFSLSFSYWIEKLKNLTKVPPLRPKKNILHVIRFKTPLRLSQVNEQSPKYSIILHEKQHSYGG